MLASNCLTLDASRLRDAIFGDPMQTNKRYNMTVYMGDVFPQYG